MDTKGADYPSGKIVGKGLERFIGHLIRVNFKLIFNKVNRKKPSFPPFRGEKVTNNANNVEDYIYVGLGPTKVKQVVSKVQCK